MANTEVSYEVVQVKATTTTTKKAVVLDETNALALIAKKKLISEAIASQTAELEKIKAELQKEKEKAAQELAEGEDEENDIGQLVGRRVK